MLSKCRNTVAMLALLSTSGLAQRPTSIPVDTAAMDAHLRFLASDLLEGRAPATRGGRLAAEYIAAQFQAWDFSRRERTGRISSRSHSSG